MMFRSISLLERADGTFRQGGAVTSPQNKFWGYYLVRGYRHYL